jgi:hypothetical protein
VIPWTLHDHVLAPFSSSRPVLISVGLYQPVASPDGRHLAYVTRDLRLEVLVIRTDVSGRVISQPLHRSLHELLKGLVCLQWSQSSQSKDSEACQLGFVLLSDGDRLVVLNADALRADAVDTFNLPAAHYVVADYQLGDQYGKLTHATFLLGEAHILTIFEMGTAVVLPVTKPQREELPNVKFTDDRSLCIAPDNKAVAVLLRSKGQDQVAIFTRSDEELAIQAVFPAHSADAQGLAWSPNGDPVIAVWDSPTYGLSVKFFSALGHPMKQLDIGGSADLGVSGNLGITAFTWISASDATTIAISDSQKQVLLREQNHKKMVRLP